MAVYRVVRKGKFDEMLEAATRGDSVTKARIEKRIRKLEQNPLHHGYWGKSVLQGYLIVPCTDRWAIICAFESNEGIVTCLVLADLDDL